LAVLALVKLVD